MQAKGDGDKQPKLHHVLHLGRNQAQMGGSSLDKWASIGRFMILGCITNQILWADIILNFAFSSFCLEIRIRHGGILWEKDKTAVYSATGLSLAFLTLILLLVKVCVEVLTAQVHSRPTNHYYDYFSNKRYCFVKKSTFSLMCAFSPVVSDLLYSSRGL